MNSFHIDAEKAGFFKRLRTAFAFIGMVYITTHWFHKTHLALLIGLETVCGSLGAFIGQGPVAILINEMGWRTVPIATAIAIMILGVLLFLTDYFHPKRMHLAAQSHSFTEALKGFKEVIFESQSWINGVVAFFIIATTMGLEELWGASFLVQTHHLSNSTASFAISMIAVGWLIGSPILGYLSDLTRKRRPFIMWGSLCAMISLLPIIYLNYLSAPCIFIVLLFVGLFSSTQLQTYTLTIMHNHDRASGSASSFINFAALSSAAVFQFLIGFYLDKLWIGESQKGVQIFTHTHWKMTMTIFPLTFLVAFILSFFLKEYYHEEY